MRWEWDEEGIHVDAPDFVGNYSTEHISDAMTDEEVILARVLLTMRPGERQRGYLYGTCIYSLLLLLYLCIEQILPQRTSGSADYRVAVGWRRLLHTRLEHGSLARGNRQAVRRAQDDAMTTQEETVDV